MKVLASSPQERRRQVFLVALLAVAGALYMWYPRTPTGTRSPASNSVTPTAVPVGSLPKPEPLKLAALSADPVPVDVGRNPFTFGVRPPPPAPRVEYTPPPYVPPPAPPPPTGPPPIALKFVMFTKLPPPDTRTMVTLKDGNLLFHAFEGDIVDGRYRILRVGPQSIDVAYADGSGRRTITLTGG